MWRRIESRLASDTRSWPSWPRANTSVFAPPEHPQPHDFPPPEHPQPHDFAAPEHPQEPEGPVPDCGADGGEVVSKGDAAAAAGSGAAQRLVGASSLMAFSRGNRKETVRG